MFQKMKLPAIPMQMVGGVSTITYMFDCLAVIRGHERERAKYLAGLLPQAIIDCPCFLDRFTGLWRYQYGAPFSVGEQFVYGTHMFTPVEQLYTILDFAEQRLPANELAALLSRLGEPEKHDDWSTEFQPVIRIVQSTSIEYEAHVAPGISRTVDWKLSTAKRPKIFIEVKNRTFDILEQMKNLQTEGAAPSGVVPPPRHDTKKLFKSVQEKFADTDSGGAIHVVWIHTSLQQEATELETEFKRLSDKSLHAAILGGWSDQVFILAREQHIEDTLLQVLQLKKGGRYIFHREGE